LPVSESVMGSRRPSLKGSDLISPKDAGTMAHNLLQDSHT
jgi:hypothetical protein